MNEDSDSTHESNCKAAVDRSVRAARRAPGPPPRPPRRRGPPRAARRRPRPRRRPARGAGARRRARARHDLCWCNYGEPYAVYAHRWKLQRELSTSRIDVDRIARASIAICRSGFVLALCCSAPLPSRAQSCSALRDLRVENTTVISAQLVDSGKFVPPVMLRRTSPEFFTAFNNLPAFCRVEAVARPSSDSEINIEVWLPATGWESALPRRGNGSYGGSINYYRLGESLQSGLRRLRPPIRGTAVRRASRRGP